MWFSKAEVLVAVQFPGDSAHLVSLKLGVTCLIPQVPTASYSWVF